jgi:hypothetical protein
MVEAIPTVLALGAAALIVFAVLSMNWGQFTVAGLSFLGAALLIYFRETRL